MRQTNLLIYRLQSQKYHGLIFCFSVQVVNDIFLFWNYNPIVGAGCWWGLWLPTRRGCTSELTASGWWTTYSWCIRISKSRAATNFLWGSSPRTSAWSLINSLEYHPPIRQRGKSDTSDPIRRPGNYYYFIYPPREGLSLGPYEHRKMHQYLWLLCHELCWYPSDRGPWSAYQPSPVEICPVTVDGLSSR